MVEQLLAAGANIEAENTVRGSGGEKQGEEKRAMLSFSIYFRYWLGFSSAAGYEVMCDMFVQDVSRERHTPVRARDSSPESETHLLTSRRFG